MKSSNIGGQAVMEGIMMRSGDQYSIGVRKPDGEIEVKVEPYRSWAKDSSIWKLPVFRGVASFFESLVVGIQCLMYSASFIEDEEEDAKKPGKEKTEEQKEKEEKWLMYGTMTFSVIFSIALFIMLPYFLAGFLRNVTTSEGVIAVAEACVRMILFLGYLVLISRMKDIQRVFMYHGAEHKCINCIEHGTRTGTECGKCNEKFQRTQTLRNQLFAVCHDRQHYFLFVYPGVFTGTAGSDPSASDAGYRRSIL